jgi:hypothetical protein
LLGTADVEQEAKEWPTYTNEDLLKLRRLVRRRADAVVRRANTVWARSSWLVWLAWSLGRGKALDAIEQVIVSDLKSRGLAALTS